MAMNPRLELRQQQRLALTPQLRQRLALLRMGPAELTEEVAQAAAQNPFLRYEPHRIGPAASAEPLAEVQVSARGEAFQEDLKRQIARKALPRLVEALAFLLIGELGPDGMLDVSLEELADEHGLPVAPLETALAALHECEPAGIGARSTGECLRLQLVDRGLTPEAAAATVAQLPALARQDWATAGPALGLDGAGLRARAALLRSLAPRPITPDEGESVILRPDLRLVRGADGTLSVAPEETSRPRLALDGALVARAEAEGFAPEMLAQARSLIEALALRGRTLARIGDWLAETQAGFFASGPEGLVPATRRDLAQALQLHPSTVTRALAGKAIDVDGRLWPLSVFFSAALPGASGPVSARAVQRRIAALISAEPPTRPLSDEKVASLLRAEGVDIARRTVAKYRDGLRIPPASRRRRQAAGRGGT